MVCFSWVQLNVADFKEMIQQVAFAASTDESRPVLMGVLLHVEKDKVTMAAMILSEVVRSG